MAKVTTPRKIDIFEFSDVERLQCLLCSRQFADIDVLKRHNLESELHQRNMQSAEIKGAALRKKTATPSKASPAPTEAPNAKLQSTPLNKTALAHVAGKSPSVQNSTLPGGVRFPAQVFDSMPNVPDIEDQRYFLLSCAQNRTVWYAAVFDGSKTLIGHAVESARDSALESALAASKKAKKNVSNFYLILTRERLTIRQTPSIDFPFQRTQLPIKKMPVEKSSDPMQSLLNVLDHDSIARILWLSWYSTDAEVWKDVCMVDGQFKSSGKDADAKTARKISCQKTIELLRAGG